MFVDSRPYHPIGAVGTHRDLPWNSPDKYSVRAVSLSSPLEEKATVLPPSDLFADLSLIGTGATSRVYRAIQSPLHRTVALKRLNRSLVRSPEALARFRRELEALKCLRHPGIATVYDVIEWAGDPTLVMQFIEGEDLNERIHRDGPLDPDTARALAESMLDILAAVHGLGVVHRDLKPQNIRVTPDGRFYLLDFGSARLDASSQLTTTGTTVGTPEYMAPELFVGSVYDPRADIYGLGATLYFAVTGRPPQLADSISELAFLRETEAVTPVSDAREGLPEGLAQVIDRCLERNPEDRFASAQLTLWSIEHPEEERAFRARRARDPLCLHCETPIDAALAACPRCDSDHPFSYEPGLAHIELMSVRYPDALMEHLITLFPERGNPTEAKRLAERTALIGWSRQRLVSFIGHREAAGLAGDLAENGVGTRVVSESRRWKWSALIGFGTGLLGVVVAGAAQILYASAVFKLPGFRHFRKYYEVGDVPALLPHFFAWGLAGFAWSRLGSFSRAATGVLSKARKLPVLPGLRRMLWTIPFVVTAGGLYFGRGIGRYIDWEPGVASALLTLGLAAAGGLAWKAGRLGYTPSATERSPEVTSVKARIAQILAPDRSPSRSDDDEPRRGMSIRGFVSALALVLLLIGAEVFAMSIVAGPLDASEPQAVLTAPEPPLEPVEENPVIMDGAYNRARDRAVRKAAQRAREREERSSMVRVGLTTIPPLLAVLVLVAGVRRRRKVQADADGMVAELDDDLLTADKRRDLPARRHDGVSPIPPLLEGSAGDVFTADAVVRASRLAPHLSRDRIPPLCGALQGMRPVVAPDEAREGSFLARCMLETDPELATRSPSWRHSG